MRFGFVTFLTENYIPYTINLINSLLISSSFDIEVYCINFLHEFIKSDRIKYKRYDTSDLTFKGILEAKIYASINSEFDISLIIEGDMIILTDIDKIFYNNIDKIKNSKVPLFAKHPHNPYLQHKNQLDYITQKSPKMNWVYANYLFTPSHRKFFENAMELSKKFTFVDEVIFNGLLIEYEIDYDLGYNYFPNCFPDTVQYYFDNNHKAGEFEIKNTYGSTPVVLWSFHGHYTKNLEFASKIVEDLKKKKSLI